MSYTKLTMICSMALILVASLALADVPQIINYQGQLTNSGGDPLDTTVSIVFTIYDDSTGGNVWWTETNPLVTTSGGVFNVLLGSINSIPDSTFDDPDRWLSIKVGSDPDLSPRSRLISMPYSYRVSTVDGASGGNISGKVAIGSGHSNVGSYTFVTGENNVADEDYATVSGGKSNSATGYASSIGGGQDNSAGVGYATVGGGIFNSAQGGRSTIGGGALDTTFGRYSGVFTGFNNLAGDEETDTAVFIGGGTYNIALAGFSTIGGGDSNYIAETGNHATIGGGRSNTASQDYATVSGGNGNTASGSRSTVSGGSSNTASGNSSAVVGGQQNTASGSFSAVVGGVFSIASGNKSTVLGGEECEAAGLYSFASGVRAKALHTGSFVWADFDIVEFSSQRDNQFRIRANGGARFDINNGRWFQVYDDGVDVITTSMGAHLTIGGVWTNASDRNLKENFSSVVGSEVLEKITQLSITSWNYKSEGKSISHIGPMAQDFYALFGLGTDDKSISTVDADGVALAAIQALLQKVEQLESRIAELEGR